MLPVQAYNEDMTSDFERFSHLILDELQSFRAEMTEFRSESSSTRAEIHELRTEVQDFRTEFNNFRGEVNSRFSHLEKEIATISSRLDAIEESIADMRGYAKEIDDLRTRISDIERHLGVARKIPA